MGFIITGPSLGQASVCIEIIRALPDWFGIESAIRRYQQDIDHLPTFLAEADGQVAGFVSLKQHYTYSAEIYVMGVRSEVQHRGIGHSLLDAAEQYARGQGVEYLQVKTLGPSHPDASYQRTRAFYLDAGYRPLEEFNSIWDENNPCLIQVKRI
jgi:N-acetylglutamate synthase-like GNAT family acetyltransferase